MWRFIMKTKRMISVLAVIIAAMTTVSCAKKEADFESGNDSISSKMDISSASSVTSIGSVSSNGDNSSSGNGSNGSGSSGGSTANSTSSSDKVSSSVISTSTSAVSSAQPSIEEPAVSTTVSSKTENDPKPVEQEWTEEEYKHTMYVIVKNAGARVKPLLGSDVVKQYKMNDQVNVVAKTNTFYYKLDNGSFIHFDFLGENKGDIAHENPSNPIIHEHPNKGLKVGDLSPNGYPIIGVTSDGIGYVAIDDEYEKNGSVIVDYFGNMPVYRTDPDKREEIFSNKSHPDLGNITMN